MTRNLGQTSLRRRRRSNDSMHIFDTLPPPLRRWLSEAILPWSPVSAHRIWKRSLARGLSPEDALISLCKAEERTLACDRQTTLFKFNSQT